MMMDKNQADLRTALRQQFGAAIDVLEDGIRACPDELWNARLWLVGEMPALGEFWYVAYHCLFWLDYYLSDVPEQEFVPHPPFVATEFDPKGAIPERPYTRDELLSYLAYGRNKCYEAIAKTADLQHPQHSKPNYPDMTLAELYMYTMRHVMEHGAQLSLFLGQHGIETFGWVSRARSR